MWYACQRLCRLLSVTNKKNKRSTQAQACYKIVPILSLIPNNNHQITCLMLCRLTVVTKIINSTKLYDIIEISLIVYGRYAHTINQ